MVTSWPISWRTPRSKFEERHFRVQPTQLATELKNGVIPGCMQRLYYLWNDGICVRDFCFLWADWDFWSWVGWKKWIVDGAITWFIWLRTLDLNKLSVLIRLMGISKKTPQDSATWFSLTRLGWQFQPGNEWCGNIAGARPLGSLWWFGGPTSLWTGGPTGRSIRGWRRGCLEQQ